MFRCCECGEVHSDSPSIRLPFDEAVRRLTGDEATEAGLLDVLGEVGLRFPTSDEAEYMVCLECAEESIDDDQPTIRERLKR